MKNAGQGNPVRRRTLACPERPAALTIEAPRSKLRGMRSLLDLSSLQQTAWSFDPQG